MKIRISRRGIVAVLLLAALSGAGCAAGTNEPGASVDCLGNGSLCTGSLSGSVATVHVTGNRDLSWKLKVSCEFSAATYSDINPPGAGTVTSSRACDLGTRAVYWNVLAVPTSIPA